MFYQAAKYCFHYEAIIAKFKEQEVKWEFGTMKKPQNNPERKRSEYFIATTQGLKHSIPPTKKIL